MGARGAAISPSERVAFHHVSVAWRDQRHLVPLQLEHLLAAQANLQQALQTAVKHLGLADLGHDGIRLGAHGLHQVQHVLQAVARGLGQLEGRRVAAQLSGRRLQFSQVQLGLDFGNLEIDLLGIGLGTQRRLPGVVGSITGGLQCLHGGLGAGQVGVQQVGLQLHQHVASLDLIAPIHRQFDGLSADLRGDGDFLDRDRAGGLDAGRVASGIGADDDEISGFRESLSFAWLHCQSNHARLRRRRSVPRPSSTRP